MFQGSKITLFFAVLLVSISSWASESHCIEKIKEIANSVSSDDVLFYDYGRNTWVTSTSQQDHLSFGRFDNSGARNVYARSEGGACIQEITRNTQLSNDAKDVISHYFVEVVSDVENDPQVSNTFGDIRQHLSSCQPYLNDNGNAALARLVTAYRAEPVVANDMFIPSTLESQDPSPASYCSQHLNKIFKTLNMDIDLQYYQRGNTFIYQDRVRPVMLVSNQGANQLFHSGQTCGNLMSDYHSGRLVQTLYEKIIGALEQNSSRAQAIQQDWEQASHFCSQIPRLTDRTNQVALEINDRVQIAPEVDPSDIIYESQQLAGPVSE